MVVLAALHVDRAALPSGEQRGGLPKHAIDEVGHPSDERAAIRLGVRRLHLDPALNAVDARVGA